MTPTLILMFIPLMILILIVALTIISINQVLRSNSGNSQWVKWMLGGYLVILLIATVVFYTLPNTNSAREATEQDGIGDLEKRTNDFIEAIKGGTVEHTTQAYLHKHLDFEYQEDQLEIQIQGNYYGIHVLVDRTDAAVGNIAVDFYTAGANVEGLDITNQLHPPLVQLNGRSLVLADPNKYDIALYSFMKEFTIRQFTGEKDRDFNRRELAGIQVLHLKLPENIEVIYDSSVINIQFIGEP